MTHRARLPLFDSLLLFSLISTQKVGNFPRLCLRCCSSIKWRKLHQEGTFLLASNFCFNFVHILIGLLKLVPKQKGLDKGHHCPWIERRTITSILYICNTSNGTIVFSFVVYYLDTFIYLSNGIWTFGVTDNLILLFFSGFLWPISIKNF